MDSPVDNLNEWAREVAQDELPYEEALARLYELRDRYELHSATALAGSAAERHLKATGHRLAFGCCVTYDTLLELLTREERALRRDVERELLGQARSGQIDSESLKRLRSGAT